MDRLLALALAPALLGCKPPPEAPAEFADLCAYLFEHQWDENQEALVVGVADLAVWLDEEWDADKDDDGYMVSPVSEEAMDALDSVDRTAVDMVGLALPTESAHAVDESTWALVMVPQDEVFPGTFTSYEREFESEPDCFVEHTCDRLQAEEWMATSYAGGLVEAESHSINQYVWAEYEGDTALVHRNWQVEPPEVNLGWMRVTEQTYLDVFVPRTGGAWRLQAQWTVYDPENNVPEDTAKALIINSFQGLHDDLEKYLDENEAP